MASPSTRWVDRGSATPRSVSIRWLGRGKEAALRGPVARAATSGGVLWVDRETLAVGDTVLLPESGLARGISVDIDGYIWAVILGGTKAYKIDPDTYAIEEVGGLNGPYTYSDMTGGQLSNVTCNRPEG
jgi:hypothetical protein